MKLLPKVKKEIGGCLTKTEKVRQVVLGIALVAGLGFTGGVPNSAHALVGQPGNAAINTDAVIKTDAVIILKPAVANGTNMVAYHQSHRSHYSHQSHRSHYSHYSSYN